MHPFGELSAQRRRLGESLRAMRANVGLSGEQLAERLGISQSRLSRIELGQQAARAELVRRWAEVTETSEDRAAELVRLAETAGTEAVVFRTARPRGLVQFQRDSLVFEATAETILEFDPVIVPGLLQVPEYARRLFTAGKPLHDTAEIAAAVAGRMDRQLALYEGATRFDFVITEAALRWRVGPPKVMIAQLDRVTALGGLETVQVGVIPLDTEVDTWHEHGFAVFEDRPDDDPVVTIETQTSQVTTTDPAEVAFYRGTFGRLRQAVRGRVDPPLVDHDRDHAAERDPRGPLPRGCPGQGASGATSSVLYTARSSVLDATCPRPATARSGADASLPCSSLPFPWPRCVRTPPALRPSRPPRQSPSPTSP